MDKSFDEVTNQWHEGFNYRIKNELTTDDDVPFSRKVRVLSFEYFAISNPRRHQKNHHCTIKEVRYKDHLFG